MTIPAAIDIRSAIEGLTFLPNRTPDMADDDYSWAATLADYRDGGVFVVHYAGQSEWERHPADEVVMVLEGSTTITLLIDGVEHEQILGAMQLIIVPESTWHRFDTPDGVKVFSISPQPSDHQVGHP